MKMNDSVFTKFHPILQRSVEALFTDGNISLTPLALTDLKPLKFYTESNKKRYISHCTLKIPYAGKKLSWELIFNPNDLSFPPDFNFNDNNLDINNDLDIEKHVPTLLTWDVHNPGSLKNLLKELLNVFKKQQLDNLQHDNIYSQLNSEYQILTEEVPSENIEFCFEGGNAHFLVKIKVDLSSLPEYLQQSESVDLYSTLLNPGEDFCILKISFLKLSSSRVNTSLQMSLRASQVLGTKQSVHIPQYSGTSSLADYVTLIEKLLQDHVTSIELNYKLKREFILTTVSAYPEKVVEYDSEMFSELILLSADETFRCLVRVELGEFFPEEQPKISLRSVGCPPTDNCHEELNNFVYSVRWSPETMSKRLIDTIHDAVDVFKNHSHKR